MPYGGGLEQKKDGGLGRSLKKQEVRVWQDITGIKREVKSECVTRAMTR